MVWQVRMTLFPLAISLGLVSAYGRSLAQTMSKGRKVSWIQVSRPLQRLCTAWILGNFPHERILGPTGLSLAPQERT